MGAAIAAGRNRARPDQCFSFCLVCFWFVLCFFFVFLGLANPLGHPAGASRLAASLLSESEPYKLRLVRELKNKKIKDLGSWIWGLESGGIWDWMVVIF